MLNSDQKRAFIAVLLSGVVLFGWQHFFAPKQDENTISKMAKEEAAKPVANNEQAPATPALESSKASPENVAPQTLSTNLIKNQEFELKINNDLSIVDMKNPNSVFTFSSLTDSALPLRIQVVTDLGPMDLFFEMEQVSETKIVGRNSNFGVAFTANIIENGKVNFNISSNKAYKIRLLFDAKPKKLDNGQIREFLVYTNDINRMAADSGNDEDGTIKWAGVDFNYHLFAVVLKEKSPAKYRTNEKGQMFIDITNATKSFDADLVFTKKNYDHLVTLGDNLHLAVDFGFFAVLAVPLLRGLQFIYNYIPNYGVAIIILTILIRLITFPLQWKSFISMKKMQLIQPELQKIKEKYKEDPQRMQKETMDLFKKAGANPLSGCLPILLQLPFFIAIYRVLYSAVELVGAPFYGWIHDLSIQDPYYVLPVLMGLSMFAQQKLTPQTSMDPTQQKIMLFMPIIFAFFMKSLPAGLVLYIFVSTVVGILQQYLVYKMAD